MLENEAIGNEGGYNKENPPHDDRCPICFGSFHFPCKANCGHWFCSNCILQYWRHSADVKQCQCPMCGSYITKLLPHSRAEIQPTEEEDKILKEIEHYNHVHNYKRDISIPHLLWRIMRHAYTIPSWSWTRRRFREDADGKILDPLKRVMSQIAWLLFILYRVCICRLCGLEIFPYWGLEIIIGMEIFLAALSMFLIVDASWHDWKVRQRERRLEAAPAVQHQVE